MSHNTKFDSLYQAANSLVLFNKVADDPGVGYFLKLLELYLEEKNSLKLRRKYHQLVSYLLEKTHTNHFISAGNPWENHLLNLIILDNNAFTMEASSGRVSPHLKDACLHDLNLLQTLCIGGQSFLELLARNENYFQAKPIASNQCEYRYTQHENMHKFKDFLVNSLNWPDNLADFITFYKGNGCSEFALFHAFRWEERGKGEFVLNGIMKPDPISFKNLIGYERQRKQVQDNTERLLQGLPAQNVLLYGDRGTGKSSTVKALVNEYGSQGIRLIQVPRTNIGGLQMAMSTLRNIPLKFILFIDDLSFEENEVNYKELKTQMEGSLEHQPANVCVYVTSNQRHLVKEYFSERGVVEQGGEIHTGDTAQEKLSLADRFGLKVTYTAPDNRTYLNIVRELAQQENIRIETDTLERLAVKWTLWYNERSGRTARQFIDNLKGRGDLDIF